MSFRKSLHWSIRLGQTAWGTMLLGASVLGSSYFGQSQDYLTNTIEATPPVTRAELRSGNAHGAVVVEGRISADNVLSAPALVAYQRSRAVRDIRDQVVWVPDQTHNPPLLIDLADGPIQVGGGYAFGGDLLTHEDAQYRHQGLARGDPVVILGKPLAGTADTLLEAEYVVRGTRAELIRSRVNLMALTIGAGLVLIGLAIMGWLLSKGYSPFGHWKTGRRN